MPEVRPDFQDKAVLNFGGAESKIQVNLLMMQYFLIKESSTVLSLSLVRGYNTRKINYEPGFLSRCI